MKFVSFFVAGFFALSVCHVQACEAPRYAPNSAFVIDLRQFVAPLTTPYQCVSGCEFLAAPLDESSTTHYVEDGRSCVLSAPPIAPLPSPALCPHSWHFGLVNSVSRCLP